MPDDTQHLNDLREDVQELAIDGRLTDSEQGTMCDLETVLTDVIEDGGV